jgi:hypothetical protein
MESKSLSCGLLLYYSTVQIPPSGTNPTSAYRGVAAIEQESSRTAEK